MGDKDFWGQDWGEAHTKALGHEGGRGTLNFER